MRRVIVRYRLKPGQAELNEELVRGVYRELNEVRPEGLRYATFRLEDDLTFVHVAEVAGEDNPLAALDAFKAFTAGIQERCDEPPQSSSMTEIGSYRLFEQEGR